MPGDQDHNEYWETPEERKRAALARRNCSDAPLITRVGESNGKAFCDADTADRELCEALDNIYKRYGSLGAFFDELQKRRPVQENDRAHTRR